MKILLRKKNIITGIIFGIMIILFTLFILFSEDFVKNSDLSIVVIISFILNGILIFRSFFYISPAGYSLKEVFYIFYFLLFFLAPLTQYFRGSWPWWDSYLITNDIVLKVNFMITISIILFELTYNNKINKSKNKFNYVNNIKTVYYTFFILSLLSFLFTVRSVGLSNMFSQATLRYNNENLSVRLIFATTFRTFPIYLLTIDLIHIYKKKKIINRFTFFIGILLFILLNFPTAVPRFWAGTVYIGLILILIKKFKNKHMFRIILLLGFLVIFPTLNFFRNSTLSDFTLKYFLEKSLIKFILSGDLDAFSMFARSVKIIDANGKLLIFQLIGNLLFFIPRSIWATKPIGSGATIAIMLGWKFTNLSMPFLSEGYINFGGMGIIIYSILLGILLKKTDTKFSNVLSIKSDNIFYIELIYPYMIGFLFFFLRGDFLSTYAYFIGFIFPIIFIYFIQKIFSTLKIN